MACLKKFIGLRNFLLTNNTMMMKMQTNFLKIGSHEGLFVFWVYYLQMRLTILTSTKPLGDSRRERWRHLDILGAMEKDGKVLCHFAPLHRAHSCLFKFLSKVLKPPIAIKFSSVTPKRRNDRQKSIISLSDPLPEILHMNCSRTCHGIWNQ